MPRDTIVPGRVISVMTLAAGLASEDPVIVASRAKVLLETRPSRTTAAIVTFAGRQP